MHEFDTRSVRISYPGYGWETSMTCQLKSHLFNGQLHRSPNNSRRRILYSSVDSPRKRVRIEITHYLPRNRLAIANYKFAIRSHDDEVVEVERRVLSPRLKLGNRRKIVVRASQSPSQPPPSPPPFSATRWRRSDS